MVFTNGPSCFDSIYLTYFLLSLTIEHVTKENVLSFIISFSIVIFLGLFTLYLKWLIFKEKNLVFSVFGHLSHRMFFDYNRDSPKLNVFLQFVKPKYKCLI